MADYEVIQDSEVEPGAPLLSSLGFRFRDNPIAIAQGAAGSPRIVSDALEDGAFTVSKIATTGDVVAGGSTAFTLLSGGTSGGGLDPWGTDNTSYWSPSVDVVHRYSFVRGRSMSVVIRSGGSIRCRSRAGRTSGGGDFEHRVLRNFSTQATWSDSSTDDNRTVDVTVEPYDIITFQLRAGSSTVNWRDVEIQTTSETTGRLKVIPIGGV